MMNINNATLQAARFFLLFACLFISSCNKFLEVDPPNSNVNRKVVFDDDNTATAAALGMYAEMVVGGFACGDFNSIVALGGLSSDELFNNLRTDALSVEFETNNLLGNNDKLVTLWGSLYKMIYQANSIVEGVSQSTKMSANTKNQVLGEAYFVRSFCYFYLVNLFGDVPLALTTAYKQNANIGKSSLANIYNQIVSDIELSTNLLSNDYAADMRERIRPNRFAAFALSARIYLFLGEWSKAETRADSVILRSDMYSLSDDLDGVFLKNNSEAIWQLRPISLISSEKGCTREGMYFWPGNALSHNVLFKGSVASFEDGDNRLKQWVDTIFVDQDTVFCPNKYKQYSQESALTEYSMVLRLAEQYLIRAEARAMQEKLTGENSAESDINEIRARAGLLSTTSVSQTDLMSDIEREKRFEFLAEWAHRWLDLKRWKKAEDVLANLKPGFNKLDEQYPIPDIEYRRNPALGD